MGGSWGEWGRKDDIIGPTPGLIDGGGQRLYDGRRACIERMLFNVYCCHAHVGFSKNRVHASFIPVVSMP